MKALCHRLCAGSEQFLWSGTELFPVGLPEWCSGDWGWFFGVSRQMILCQLDPGIPCTVLHCSGHWHSRQLSVVLMPGLMCWSSPTFVLNRFLTLSFSFIKHPNFPFAFHRLPFLFSPSLCLLLFYLFFSPQCCIFCFWSFRANLNCRWWDRWSEQIMHTPWGHRLQPSLNSSASKLKWTRLSIARLTVSYPPKSSWSQQSGETLPSWAHAIITH